MTDLAPRHRLSMVFSALSAVTYQVATNVTDGMRVHAPGFLLLGDVHV